MHRVLVVDDDKNIRFAFHRILDTGTYAIEEAGSGEEALAKITPGVFSVIYLDLRMPGLSGMDVLSRIQQIDNKVRVVIMTAFGTTEVAIEAVKRGAYDFVLKPFEVDEIKRLTENGVNAYRLMTRKVDLLAGDDIALEDTDTLVGQSRAMQEVYKQIGRVAESDANVLIRGASGTGKELAARAIYHHSRRADKPFLAVNCAAIPEGLLESELFGHERGAFTSAEHRRLGKFERATTGTLFLDEIGDMSPGTQAKILRVLQDGVIERVGGSESIHVDVRIIAATHRDLTLLIRQGLFREDLYFRLNVFTIELPSLDERREDIPLLVRYFVSRGNRHLGRHISQIPRETMDRLLAHSWRGNVRELENVIDRALIVTNGPTLLPESISFADTAPAERAGIGTLGDTELLDAVFARLADQFDLDPHNPILPALEREMLARAIARTEGNQVQTARLLGISRQTLRNRLAEDTDPGEKSND
ncbi:MAG: sigma-54-dependent Fis family transcriptional regulator [candidate division Zixibacteria bacterium]|nr:sigma-54-dependent Fis family transcriptional regulator [candidate division Zixibacteria bacterium]